MLRAVLIGILRVMGIMGEKKIVASLWQPHKNMLCKHLLEKIYAHYGNSIFHTGDRWLIRGNLY